MAGVKFTLNDPKQEEQHSAQAGPSGQDENATELTTPMKTSISTESKPSLKSPRLSSTTPFLSSVPPSQTPSGDHKLETKRLDTSSQSRPSLEPASNSAPPSSAPPTGNFGIEMTISDPLTTDVEMEDIRPGD